MRKQWILWLLLLSVSMNAGVVALVAYRRAAFGPLTFLIRPPRPVWQDRRIGLDPEQLDACRGLQEDFVRGVEWVRPQFEQSWLSYVEILTAPELDPEALEASIQNGTRLAEQAQRLLADYIAGVRSRMTTEQQAVYTAILRDRIGRLPQMQIMPPPAGFETRQAIPESLAPDTPQRDNPPREPDHQPKE